ncbi:MAG: DNA alkylation repair protein [Sulfuricella sp.]|nr:DNA alkylation repair protein [Sulfuricella sp.]
MKTTPLLPEIQARLQLLADPATALGLQRFFKTGPGQYGAGDVFIGIKVPTIRKLAAEFSGVGPGDAAQLLRSPHHEARILALLFLMRAFERGAAAERQQVYDLYLAATSHINNWDLVDISAPHVVGAHLADKARAPLYRLAQSDSLWERRIAIVATFHFIRRGDFGDTLAIAEHLLADREDLIHKATGWMLREVGKRDPAPLEAFLKRHCRTMPRTMLRYAIERFPTEKRQAYLRGG